jgi:hypothetical protein
MASFQNDDTAQFQRQMMWSKKILKFLKKGLAFSPTICHNTHASGGAVNLGV